MLLKRAGLSIKPLFKIQEGRPNVLDLIKNGEIHFIINTPSGQQPRKDEVVIRSAAVAAPCGGTDDSFVEHKASANAIRA